jgi:hypothetical protein
MLLGLAAAAGLQPAAAALPDAGPGMTRIWFLNPADSASETGWGAAPTIYANGTPIAAIPADAAFYRDFAPGTYRFTVQPYGQPTGQTDTVQLAAGTEAYLEVQWAATWEEGYASGSGINSHSFFIQTISPQLAQAWLPSLTDLGRR